MKYSDDQRIDKIISTTGKLLAYPKQAEITRDDILNQEPIRWTITTPLYNIGEQAYSLSDDFKAAHPDIPWAKISGLRHRLVHDYDNTNWRLVCTLLFDVLPEFLEAVEQLRNEAT